MKRDLPSILLVVGGGLLTYSFLRWAFRRRSPVSVSVENQEWLARILLTEAGDIDDEEEWAGIAWVALNRAAAANTTVREVVATKAWFGAAPPARLFSAGILEGRRAAHALEFAGRVLAGEVENPIGDRTHFVHPSGMPRCDSEGAATRSRVCRRTYYGLRQMPYWAIDSAEGGSAEYTPEGHGRAVFAELPWWES